MLGEREVFAENLQRYMEKYEMSGSDLARLLGCDRTLPSAWLHGKSYPRIETLERISKIFNCNKSDLVDSPQVIGEISKLTSDEYKMLAMYRAMDENTKQALLTLMTKRKV